MSIAKSVDDLSRELDEMRKRLEALEDERKIRETLHAYCHTIDYGPPEAWAEVFTADGVFDVSRAHGVHTRRKTGRAELVGHMQGKHLPPELHDKHVLCVPIINIAGKTATAESYLLMFREFEGGPRLRSWGHYRDTLEKQSDGRWLLKEKIAVMETGIGRHWKEEWNAAAKSD